MLKRTLCAAFAVAVLVAFSVPAFAGSHHKMRVRGTVESVDPAQKTFVVKDRDGKAIPFRVDDRSEFELEQGQARSGRALHRIEDRRPRQGQGLQGRTTAPRG